MEMLLLAELISYPYNLRQISPDSLIPFVMDPVARKVLDVLIVMKNNDEEVSLSNVSYHLSDKQVIERLTNSFLKVATDSSIQQHIVSSCIYIGTILSQCSVFFHSTPAFSYSKRTLLTAASFSCFLRK